MFSNSETRHGHGEIRLPGTGRPDTKGHVAALDGLKIAHLVEAARSDRPPAEGALSAAQHQVPESQIRVFRNNFEEALDVAVGEAVPFPKQEFVVGKYVLGAADRLGIPLDLDAVIEQVSADAEGPFEQTDVLVAGPEKRLDALRDTDARLAQSRLLLLLNRSNGMGEKWTASRMPGGKESCLIIGTSVVLRKVPEDDLLAGGIHPYFHFEYSPRGNVKSIGRFDNSRDPNAWRTIY